MTFAPLQAWADRQKNAPALVQGEFEFVEDRVGRYWDCCTLVTNDGKLNTASFAQIFRNSRLRPHERRMHEDQEKQNPPYRASPPAKAPSGRSVISKTISPP